MSSDSHSGKVVTKLFNWSLLAKDLKKTGRSSGIWISSTQPMTMPGINKLGREEEKCSVMPFSSLGDNVPFLPEIPLI